MQSRTAISCVVRRLTNVNLPVIASDHHPGLPLDHDSGGTGGRRSTNKRPPLTTAPLAEGYCPGAGPPVTDRI